MAYDPSTIADAKKTVLSEDGTNVDGDLTGKDVVVKPPVTWGGYAALAPVGQGEHPDCPEPTNRYTMDNISGSTLTDEKADTNGTITNMTQTEGGKFGAYLAGGSITSAAKNVDFGSGSLPFTSIAFWMRRTGLGSIEIVLDWNTSNRHFYCESNDALVIYNGSSFPYTDFTIDDTDWHHVVLVEGSSNNSHWVWLDGVKNSSELTTNYGGVFRYIGRGTSYSGHYSPDADNIQVFDEVLTQSQVTALYNAGLPLYKKISIQDASDGSQLPVEISPAEWEDWLAPTNHYLCNDSGSTLTDLMEDTDGTITNMTPTVGGPFDNYLAGGSVSSTIRNVDFGVSEIPFTSLSIWFQKNGASTADSIFFNTGTTRGCYAYSDSSLYLWNGSVGVDTGHNVSDTNWHHLVLVQGSTTNHHWVYLDGVKSASEINGLLGTTFRYLGRGNTTTAQYVPNLTNAQVYDTKLTDAQIARLYAAQSQYYHPGRQCVLYSKTDMTSASGASLVLSYDETQDDNGSDIHPDTVLLVESFNKPDGNTAFEDKSPIGHTVTGYGNAEHSTDQTKFSASTIHTDGTGDYLSVADHDSLTLGSSNFTIRAWVYLAGYANNNGGQYNSCIIAKDANGHREFSVNISGTSSSFTSIRFLGFSDNTTYTEVSETYSFSLDTWYHVEITRSGDLIYIFVDGVLLNTGGTAFSRTIQNASDSVTIGANLFDATYLYYLNGYMQSVQIINGTGLHTDDFTVPDRLPSFGYVGLTGETGAQSVWDSNYKAVYHMAQDPSGGTDCILDSTSNGNHGTPAGTMLTGDLVDGAIGKGLDFEGTDDKIVIADDATLQLGTGDYTLEVFFKADVVSYGASDQGTLLAKDYTGFEISVYEGDLDGFAAGTAIDGPVISTDTWYHGAHIRNSGTVTPYLNASAGSGVSASGSVSEVGDPVTIGERLSGSYYFNGIISEVRISNTARSAAWIKVTNLNLTDSFWTWSAYIGAATNPYEIDLTIAAQSETLTDFPVTVPLQANSGLTSFDTSAVFNYLGPLAQAESPDVEPTSHWTTDTTSLTLAEASDDFTGTDGDAPDTHLWLTGHDVIEAPTSGTATIQLNKLRLSIASDNSAPYVCSKFMLQGDFDIEVEMDPQQAGSDTNRYYFDLDTSNTGIIRGTKWASFYKDSNWHYRTYNSDSTGTEPSNPKLLRFVRTGSSLVFYVWETSTWTSKKTDASFGTDDMYVVFGARTNTTSTLDVDFDDFTVNSADSIDMLVDEKAAYGGTITNMTPTVGGKFDNYLAGGLSTSVDRHVDLGSQVAFKSISMWVKRNVSSAYEYLLRDGTSSIYYNSTNNILTGYNGTSEDGTGLPAITDTDWHHVVIVEGSNNNDYWVWQDGVQASTETTIGFGGTNRYLGLNGTYSGYYTIGMANVQWFDETLTDAQVRDLYLVDKDRFATNMLHENTVLYIESNDTDGATDFWDLSDSAHRIDCNTPTHSTTQRLFAKSAIRIAGDAQGLEVDNHTDFNAGTGDYTLRGWFWFDNTTTEGYHVIGSGGSWASGTGFEIRKNGASSGTTRFSLNGPSWTQVYGTTDFSEQAWLHLEWCRSGTSTYLFVNGKQEISFSNSTSMDFSNQHFRIGGYGQDAKAVSMYCQGVEVIIGTCLHTSDFTPPICLPSAPDYRKLEFWNEAKTQKLYGEIELWETWDNTALRGLAHTKATLGTSETVLKLNHNPANADNSAYVDMTTSSAAQSVWNSAYAARYGMNQDPSISDILDSTSNVNHGTPSGTWVSSALVDSGVGKALDFDGGTQYILVDDDPTLDLAGPLTLEARYIASSVVNTGILEKGPYNGSHGKYSLTVVTASAGFRFLVNAGASKSGGSPVANTWYYQAGVYDLTDLDVFIDGVSLGTPVAYSTGLAADANHLRIGAYYSANYELDGQIFEVRISSAARSATWIAATNNTLTDNLIAFSQAVVITPDGTVVGYRKPLSMFAGFPTRYTTKQLFPGFKSNSRYLLPKYSTFFGYLLWLIHTGQVR